MTFTFKTTAEEAAATLKDHIVGKNVVITGVSPKSLGAENVRVLAPYAKTIIVASRSKERAAEAVKETLSQTPSANIKIVALDLMSGDSIRTAAAEVLAFDIPIHVVIDNAAVAQSNTLVRTKEGFDSQFGANLLGHFLFIHELLPAILREASASNPARVISASSMAATWSGDLKLDNINYTLRPEEYERHAAYARSKTANVLFAVGLAKRFGPRGVLAYSLHPGVIIETNMGSSIPTADLVNLGLLKPDGTPHDAEAHKTIETGTSTQVIAAFDPSIVNQNGAFLDDGVVHNDRLPTYALNEQNSDALWELSEKAWVIKF